MGRGQQSGQGKAGSTHSIACAAAAGTHARMHTHAPAQARGSRPKPPPPTPAQQHPLRALVHWLHAQRALQVLTVQTTAGRQWVGRDSIVRTGHSGRRGVCTRPPALQPTRIPHPTPLQPTCTQPRLHDGSWRQGSWSARGRHAAPETPCIGGLQGGRGCGEEGHQAIVGGRGSPRSAPKQQAFLGQPRIKLTCRTRGPPPPLSRSSPDASPCRAPGCGPVVCWLSG